MILQDDVACALEPLANMQVGGGKFVDSVLGLQEEQMR